MNDYEKTIAITRYARWLPEEASRETWEETVGRYAHFWQMRQGVLLAPDVAEELRDAIVNLEVMPSMRSLMTAGPALERDNVAGFNCSYLPMDSARSFDELMYILLCGTGVGFSVESRYTSQLPPVAEEFHDTDTTIHVPDSKVGWAKSFRQLVSLLYAGEIPKWDTSRVRGAGEPLKTFGGRASGPQPLIDLFVFTAEMFKHAAGRKLSTIEVADVVCKVADVIVVGGVRRSALICLSDPYDNEMRKFKTGQWYMTHPWRRLANISAAYDEKPTFRFMQSEMKALHESESGERGFFSREACVNIAARNGRRDSDQEFGTNPCSEIILRPYQFCNLSEVVVRADDTLDSLKEKVRKATILGTLQATLTDFRYLRKIWKTNTEEEALLGVSLTGIMDHPVLSTPDCAEWLEEMREVAIETNKEWAERLGIKQAAAITCVKPSGTVSQLVNSASGIHPRHYSHYIRSIRQDVKDPITAFLQAQGIRWEVDNFDKSSIVFYFPIAAPDGALTNEDVDALYMLKLWKVYQDHSCEHKPSITVSYTDDNFFDVCSWMWSNFDSLSGISLMPQTDASSYTQLPYEQVTKEQYLASLAEQPVLDWTQAASYETGVDSTESSQQLACVGGSCDI
jgi:ribonucleoside-diphosphate reductase alpha chain